MEVEIKKVWAVEQEILDVVHTICERHHLKYALAYGTLIGAIRHQGFIPWDDDIDIMMPREDYEKLKKLWPEEAPEGYLYKDYTCGLDYTNNFAKIVKDHTTFLQTEEARSMNYHKGIFVDIFPGDRVAPNVILQKVQYVACAVNLLFSRGYRSGNGGIVSLVEKILLKLPRKNYIRYRLKSEKWIRKWNGHTDAKYVFPCTIQASRNQYPATLFDVEKVPFQGKEYYAPVGYDEVLRVEYGDYMQLPPEEDRVWKHHPILIDFEHNYEELLH